MSRRKLSGRKKVKPEPEFRTTELEKGGHWSWGVSALKDGILFVSALFKEYIF